MLCYISYLSLCSVGVWSITKQAKDKGPTTLSGGQRLQPWDIDGITILYLYQRHSLATKNV